MISLPIFILTLFIELIAFIIFYKLKHRKNYVNNKEKVIDSIRRIREDLDTLEHRIKLNERESKK